MVHVFYYPRNNTAPTAAARSSADTSTPSAPSVPSAPGAATATSSQQPTLQSNIANGEPLPYELVLRAEGYMRHEYNEFNNFDVEHCKECSKAIKYKELTVICNGSIFNRRKGYVAHLECFKPPFYPNSHMFGASALQLMEDDRATIATTIAKWQNDNSKQRRLISTLYIHNAL